MKHLLAFALLPLALGCSDAVMAPDSGFNIADLDGTIHGSPYEAGVPDGWGADGAAGDTDAGLDGEVDGADDPDVAVDGGGGDAETDGGADGATADTGPKVCPVDLLGSSRAAGDLKFGDSLSGDIAYDCDAARYSVILAKGQSVRVKLLGPNLLPGLHFFGPGVRGLQLEDVTKARGATASVEFAAVIPGEYYAVADQSGRHGTSAYTISLECLDKCDLRATRYPIVMVHGFSGFMSIGPIEYFYKIVDTFAPPGYDLHIAIMDAYNSTLKRGPQLAAYVDEVMAATYARKVNVIAHSQGGIDTRYIISGMSYGDRVGMLNMIASPHQGTELCDVILDDPTGIGKPILDALLTVMGAVLDGPEAEQNAQASFESISTRYMRDEFNPKYPDDPRVAYKSWGGKTCYAWESCGTAVNTYLVATYELLKSKAGDNDGIVPTESAKWTGWQGPIAADHFDEVGQIAGATGPFDHLAFYRGIIEAMWAEGY